MSSCARAFDCTRGSLTRTAASFLPHRTSLTRLWVLVDRREDAALVEHHVHVLLVPERGEDLAADAEGRPAVVILLDCLRQCEREPAGLLVRNHLRPSRELRAPRVGRRSRSHAEHLETAAERVLVALHGHEACSSASSGVTSPPVSRKNVGMSMAISTSASSTAPVEACIEPLRSRTEKTSPLTLST